MNSNESIVSVDTSCTKSLQYSHYFSEILCSMELDSNSRIAALQEAGPASKAVALGAKALGVAAFAVDVVIGRVAAQDGVERPFAVAAGEAFLNLRNSFILIGTACACAHQDHVELKQLGQRHHWS